MIFLKVRNYKVQAHQFSQRFLRNDKLYILFLIFILGHFDLAQCDNSHLIIKI